MERIDPAIVAARYDEQAYDAGDPVEAWPLPCLNCSVGAIACRDVLSGSAYRERRQRPGAGPLRSPVRHPRFGEYPLGRTMPRIPYQAGRPASSTSITVFDRPSVT